MKDLVIKADQLHQLFNYLQDQPHKFAAPLFGFLNQLINEQEQPAPAEAAPAAPEQAAE